MKTIKKILILLIILIGIILLSSNSYAISSMQEVVGKNTKLQSTILKQTGNQITGLKFTDLSANNLTITKMEVIYYYQISGSGVDGGIKYITYKKASNVTVNGTNFANIKDNTEYTLTVDGISSDKHARSLVVTRQNNGKDYDKVEFKIIYNGFYGDLSEYGLPGEIMSNSGFAYLNSALGRGFTAFGNEIALNSFSMWQDQYFLFTGWIHCAKPTASNAFKKGLKLMATMDIGTNREHADNPIAKTYDGSKIETKEGGHDSNFAKLAYWACISDYGLVPSDMYAVAAAMGELPKYQLGAYRYNLYLDNDVVSLWYKCFKKVNPNVNIEYQSSSGSSSGTVKKEFDSDSKAYAEFVSNLNKTSGGAIVVDKKNSSITQSNGKVSGIKFSKFVVDKHEYHNTMGEWPYTATNNVGRGDTHYNIIIEATLANGTKVTSDTSNITVKNSKNKTVKPINMTTSDTYSVTVPGASNSNPVVSLKFKASYEIIHARVAFFMQADSSEQARVITGADKIQIVDETEVISEEEKDQPIILIQKKDVNNTMLKGATFNVTVKRKDNNKTQTLKSLQTNDKGQIIINTKDLTELDLKNITEKSIELEITLKETVAPAGYRLIKENIIVNVTFNKGSVTINSSNENVTTTTSKISYKDEAGSNATATVGVITVTDQTDDKSQPILVIQKNDTNGSALNNAEFKVTVKNTNNNKSKTLTGQKTNDAGQIIINTKDLENLELGDLSKESVKFEITLTETTAPEGYIKISGNIVINMEYKAGKVIKISSTNANVTTKINNISYIDDEGKSAETEVGVVIVKNTPETPPPPVSELQPINIIKVDSQTKARLSNVDFKVTIATTEISDCMNSTLYKTSDNGIIAIDKNILQGIGVGNNYTGDVYILLEEVVPKSGYKNLSDKVYIKVTYKNGKIDSAERLQGTATLTTSTNNGQKILSVEIPNEKKLPDLIISKESLSNNVTEIINSANLSIKVTAKNGRTTQKNGQVDVGGHVIITSEELATLGIDGTYTGKLIVDIHESTVETGAVVLPEDVKVTLELQNGRFKSSTTTSEVHTSIIDNEASIEIKVLNYKEPTYMPISGIVWEELATTKAQNTLIDGMYTTASETDYSDKLFEGIEVTLYKVNNGKLQFVNATKGTNPTFTDNKGHYEFQVPQGTSGYVVKFTYNGQIYTPAAPSKEYNALTEFNNWKLSSKASELQGDRSKVNNLLKEIGSYPANYEMTSALFSGSVISTTNNLRTAYNAGYNVAYTQAELGNLYREIADEMKADLAKTQNIDVTNSTGLNKVKTIYTNVAKKHSDDSEIYNKLQYIYDTRVSAYAGYNTVASGIATDTSAKTYPYSGDTSKDYKVQQYVNLGLVKRDSTDLTLLKDVENVTLTVNGYNINYDEGYGAGNSKYTQALEERDINYSVNSNTNGLAFYESNKIDLYVQYKITVTNSTNTSTKLTEVVDYYDSRFEYSSIRADKIDAKGNRSALGNVTASDNSKYISATKIGLTGTNQYSQLFIKFDSEPNIVDREKIEIFVTFKLSDKKDAEGNITKTVRDILKEATDEGKKLTEYNYAEINGYITDGGFLDKDSKPGTFKVKDFKNAKAEYETAYKNRKDNKIAYAKALENLIKVREDDAWEVELNFERVNNKAPRVLTGNVWTVLEQEGIPVFDKNKDKGIKEIWVYIDELNNGNQVTRAKTQTNDEGEYTISGYLPGEYTVRFVYNGAEYQSSKANPNTDKDKYWYNIDTDTRYSDAYDDGKQRIDIINSEGDGTTGDYTYLDVLNNTNNGEIKTMNAYTSTIVVEYDIDRINNIDFCLVENASGDLELNKYVSNIKVYLQDGTLQLNATIDKNGNITYSNDPIYNNIVNVFPKDTNMKYKDGLIEALIDEQLLNGATLEITYTIEVTNNGTDSKIKYIYSGDTPVAVAYYEEAYNTLPLYEDGRIVYHDSENNTYTYKEVSKEKTITSESKVNVSELVDYVDPRLNFIKNTKDGTAVNQDWETTTNNGFESSRKENTDIMNRYNLILKAVSNSDIYKTLKPGETVSTTLTLSTLLSTSSTETNDWKYSNLAEITKIHSENGKIKLQGYDITGEEKKESSEVMNKDDIKDNIYATLGTAKSETLMLHAPTGQNRIEKILSNTVIVLIAVSILAGGIVLIKKFVLTKKN